MKFGGPMAVEFMLSNSDSLLEPCAKGYLPDYESRECLGM